MGFMTWGVWFGVHGSGFGKCREPRLEEREADEVLALKPVSGVRGAQDELNVVVLEVLERRPREVAPVPVDDE